MKTFYDAKFEVTDFGACCAILPYLNFVNPETAKLSPDEYTGEQWHYQKKGAQVCMSSTFYTLTFSYDSALCSFYLIMTLKFFLQNNIGTKADGKILIKFVSI